MRKLSEFIRELVNFASHNPIKSCIVFFVLLIIYSRLHQNAKSQGMLVPQYIFWEIMKGIKNFIVFIFRKFFGIFFGTSNLVFNKAIPFTWRTSTAIAKKGIETYEKSQDRNLELKKILSQEKIVQQQIKEEERRNHIRKREEQEREKRFQDEKVNSEILNLVSLRINQEISDRQFRQQLNILKVKYPTVHIEEIIKRVLI